MNAIDNELSPLHIPGLEDELTAVLCAAISWGGSVISTEEYVAAKQRFRAAVNAAFEATIEADRKRGGVNSTHTLGELECNHCGGTGDVSGEYPGIACPDCAGTGKAPQPAEPVKRKRRYAQGTALGEFGIIPMCDQVDDEPVNAPPATAYCQHPHCQTTGGCQGPCSKKQAEPVSNSLSKGLPEGHVLVPKHPTAAMLSAAQRAWLQDPLRRTTTLWDAMLAAAPKDAEA